MLAVIAVRLAGSRDVGASIVPDRATSQPHLRLLSGPTGLAVRMVRPTVIGWWVAIAVSGLLYGLIAKSAGATISGSSVHRVFSKLGAPGTGADAVLGVCFLILAVLVAFVGAGQLTAARSEESGGRLDHLLVRPVSRTSWLGGRLVVAVAVLLVERRGCGSLRLARCRQPARRGELHDVAGGRSEPGPAGHRDLGHRGAGIRDYALG